MNKRANIPIIIFVLGIAAACIFALLSFAVPSGNTTNDMGNHINLIRSVNALGERYDFYINVGEDKNKALEYLNNDYFLYYIHVVEKGSLINFDYKMADGFSVKYEKKIN